MTKDDKANPASEIVLYQAEDRAPRIEVTGQSHCCQKCVD